MNCGTCRLENSHCFSNTALNFGIEAFGKVFFRDANPQPLERLLKLGSPYRDTLCQ